MTKVQAAARAILALLVCVPLLALTAVVSGASEAPLVGWTGVTIAAGFVVCAALGRRVRLALFVLFVAGFAASLVLFSTLFSNDYENQYEIEHAQLAWPFPFVDAELTFTPETFPQTFSWNPWEHPSSGDGLMFLASLVTVFVPLLVLTLGARAVIARRRRRAGAL